MSDFRIQFQSKQDRNEFFSELKQNVGLESWEEIYVKFQISRSNFQLYKSGKTTLSESLFKKFLNYFPVEKRAKFESKIVRISGNLGQVLGGKITQMMHPELFENGRKIANSPERVRLRKNCGHRLIPYKQAVDLNFPLTLKLCEFLGAFIGDGCTNKHGSQFQTLISGDSRYEKEYQKYLASLIMSVISGLKPNTYFYKNKNAMYTRFQVKIVHGLLTKRFKFVAGKKAHIVQIPDEILRVSQEHIFATIRGIFDTDGCVFLDKRKAYVKPYPRITLQTVSKPLHMQLEILLRKHFPIYSTQTNRGSYCIEIYGFKNLEKWVDLIGFSNPKHLKKVEEATPEN